MKPEQIKTESVPQIVVSNFGQPNLGPNENGINNNIQTFSLGQVEGHKTFHRKIWLLVCSTVFLSLISIFACLLLWPSKFVLLLFPLFIAILAIVINIFAIIIARKKIPPSLCLVLSVPALLLSICVFVVFGFIMPHIGSGIFSANKGGYIVDIPIGYEARYHSGTGSIIASTNSNLLTTTNFFMPSNLREDPFVVIIPGSMTKTKLTEEQVTMVYEMAEKSFIDKGGQLSNSRKFDNNGYSINEMVITDASGFRSASGSVMYPNRNKTIFISVALPEKMTNDQGIELLEKIALSIRQ